MKQKKITFESFLSGAMAENYIVQKTPYPEQIFRAASLLREAEYVLIGAGAGMSTAAGAVYGGAWFAEHFAEFQKRYGSGMYMQDMYSAGFYPYPSEEAYWGYWSKQALLAGADADHTPLHRLILDSLKGKKVFCLSTNADGQFEKAGLPPQQIFCTQGDYFHIQCAKGCHPKRYPAVKLFRKMDTERKNCEIPSALVPKCPVCGGSMSMNLRIDRYFVQDSEWEKAESNFSDFLGEALESGRKLCLLELGVGFNTPTIIRFPFENLVRKNRQASLIRLNLNEAVLPEELSGRAVGINADIKQSAEDIFSAPAEA